MEELAEVRKDIGKIGVVSAQFTPELNMSASRIDKSVVSRHYSAGLLFLFLAVMAKSKADSASGGIMPGFESFLVFLAALPTSIVFFSVGAGKGHVRLDIKKRKINKAMNESDIQGKIRDRVAALIEEKGDRDVEIVLAEGPESGTLEKDYNHLLKKGIDTVLETSVMHVGFQPTKEVKNLRELFVLLRVRLINTIDNRKIYENFEIYNSYRFESDTFAEPTRLGANALEEWVNNNAKLFKDELGIAIIKLAEKTVSDVL
ncbi:hypothetical protein KAR91_35360 [Candidatus Pacearchaeota archaeon]|nr:hypothetical protein [Candidatus Pacearchaeota archaeon]